MSQYAPPESLTLEQWLERIQSQHPVEIDMGLHRVAAVAANLGLCASVSAAAPRLAPLVITVGGTNGKGSCVAMLDAILRAAGKRVGTFTSPHLLRYNERVCINGDQVSDAMFCKTFEQIWQAQQDISLSYFEYGTLAALLLLQQAGLDVVILEVGLGGRLDAVNIIDADITVISSIDLDHQEWLGDTRELIGFEKAGIFRSGRPAVCGDIDLPLSVRQHAQQLNTPLFQQGVDYRFGVYGNSWQWTGCNRQRQTMQIHELPVPELDLVNAATVLQVLALLPFTIDTQTIKAGLRGLGLQGRFQQLQDPRHNFPVFVDVAHNPHAARMLAEKLRNRTVDPHTKGQGRIHFLLAMMHDKDHAEFFLALENVVDIWYIAHFDQQRCLSANKLLEVLLNTSAATAELQHGAHQFRGPFQSLQQAYERAWSQCQDGDMIVAAGSFFTVAAIMQLINDATA